MNVNSVTSNASAYTNATAQTNQTAQAQQIERSEPRPEERVELNEEAPKPVTNTLGQKTGSIISVTA